MYSFSFQLQTDSFLKTTNLSAPARCWLPAVRLTYREKKWIQSEDSSGAPHGCSSESWQLSVACAPHPDPLKQIGIYQASVLFSAKESFNDKELLCRTCSPRFPTSIHFAMINFTLYLNQFNLDSLCTKDLYSFWFENENEYFLKKISLGRRWIMTHVSTSPMRFWRFLITTVITSKVILFQWERTSNLFCLSLIIAYELQCLNGAKLAGVWHKP